MAYKIKRPVAPYYIPLSDKIEKQLDNEWNTGQRMQELRSLKVGDHVTYKGKQYVYIGESGGEVELVPFGAHIGEAVKVNWWEFTSHSSMKEKGKGWHGDSIGHSLAALKAQAKKARNTPMKKEQQPKDIWLNIRTNEMMRDTMKSLIQEIKSHNIQYTSYSSPSGDRLYLHLKDCPESFNKELGNWIYYQPVTQMKKPPNISDYDVTDW